MKFLVRNEENSRNFPTYFFTSKEHLICPKSAQKNAKFYSPKKCHIFCKRHTIFDPPNNYYCIFMHHFFFRYKIFHFFQFLRPILAKKPFILGWWIPCFPCLFSLWGIPCHQIPWFLIPHEEMPCVVAINGWHRE